MVEVPGLDGADQQAAMAAGKV